MHKIRKDDLVKVIAGKDKDKTGKVLSVKDGKVLVEGCNMITKHAKPNAANGHFQRYVSCRWQGNQSWL